mgnify:CR=1 FL=1
MESEEERPQTVRKKSRQGRIWIGIAVTAATIWYAARGIPFSSVLILFLLIVTFTIFKGTVDKPAGFRYLVAHYKKGEYKHFFLSLFAIPLFSFLMGFFIMLCSDKFVRGLRFEKVQSREMSSPDYIFVF